MVSTKQRAKAGGIVLWEQDEFWSFIELWTFVILCVCGWLQVVIGYDKTKGG